MSSRLARLPLLRPLRIRDFALLWTAMTVSLVGDGIYFVAIAWQVYDLSNVPTALSVVGLAWTAPQVAFLLVGGVASDRFDRRRVMVVADLVRAAAIGTIAALALTGALELWHLLVLVALYGAGEALFMPAFTAIVPDVVPAELLVEANALDVFVRTAASRLVGPVLAGAAIAWVGAGGAFVLDAASFLVSAAALAMLRPRPLPSRDVRASAFADVAEGLRFVRSHAWLWGTLVSAAVSLLVFYGPWEVLLPYRVRNELGGSASDLGLVFASGGLGAIVFSVLMSGRPLPRRHITLMYLSWAASNALLVVYATATALWQLMAAAFFAGGLGNAGMIVWMTLMQMRVPRELLGRVSSLDWFVSIGLIPVSFALTGPIAEAVGARETLAAAGVLGAAIIVLFLLLVPGIRDGERAAVATPSPGTADS
ncbi:MAG: MFS transporter [Actinomycetota bacterium]|nr:MFS transporter [Actinomycetota bacterium]